MVAAQYRLVTDGLHVDTSSGDGHIDGLHAQLGSGRSGIRSQDGVVPLACHPDADRGAERMCAQDDHRRYQTDPDWRAATTRASPPAFGRTPAAVPAGSSPLQLQRSRHQRADSAERLHRSAGSTRASRRQDANDLVTRWTPRGTGSELGRSIASPAPVLAINSADDFIKPKKKTLRRLEGLQLCDGILIPRVPRARYVS